MTGGGWIVSDRTEIVWGLRCGEAGLTDRALESGLASGGKTLSDCLRRMLRPPDCLRHSLRGSSIDGRLKRSRALRQSKRHLQMHFKCGPIPGCAQDAQLSADLFPPRYRACSSSASMNWSKRWSIDTPRVWELRCAASFEVRVVLVLILPRWTR